MYLDVLSSKEWRTVKRCLLRTGHQVPGHGFSPSAPRQSTATSCVGPHSPPLAPPPSLPIPLGVTSYCFALTHDDAYVPMFPRSMKTVKYMQGNPRSTILPSCSTIQSPTDPAILTPHLRLHALALVRTKELFTRDACECPPSWCGKYGPRPTDPPSSRRRASM